MKMIRMERNCRLVYNLLEKKVMYNNYIACDFICEISDNREKNWLLLSDEML